MYIHVHENVYQTSTEITNRGNEKNRPFEDLLRI